MDFTTPTKKHAKSLKSLFSQLTGREIINIDILAMQNPSQDYLVLENNGEVVGFGALISYYLPTVGMVGKIEEIIVDEKFRGQGLGRKLLEKLLKTATNKKLVKVQLTSNPKRIAARKLYESLGFTMKDTDVFIKEL